MTNKLRSVIDNKIKACKGIYGFFPKNDRTNDQELCVKVELVELLIQEGLEEALDAIIEDMRFHRDYYDKESGMYAHGYVAALTLQINQLKQARDELSILLTQ